MALAMLRRGVTVVTWTACNPCVTDSHSLPSKTGPVGTTRMTRMTRTAQTAGNSELLYVLGLVVVTLRQGYTPPPTEANSRV